MNLKEFLIRLLPADLLDFLINRKHNHGNFFPVVYNIGRRCGPQRRVLISYVNQYLNIGDWNNQTSTRNVECAEIVDAFLSLGCCVDICRHDDVSISNDDYDIIFGFGQAYRLAVAKNPNAKKILYLTEKPPYFSSHKEYERLKNLYNRHGIKVPVSRSGLFYQDIDMTNFDACVMIGQDEDKQLLEKKQVFTLYPTGLLNTDFKLPTEILDENKNNFLWLGSRGAVHKGLDLLFDVFSKHPELTLHVAGFNAIDKKRLLKIIPSNVIDHGFVDIRSKTFVDIARTCTFIISASCSEGVSTALITGMNHGLIPLRSVECSIYFDTVGEIFAENTIDCIENTIMKWTKKDFAELLSHRHNTMVFSRQAFGIRQFSSHIHDIIGTIIGQ